MSAQLLPKTLGSFILFFLKKHKLSLFVFFAKSGVICLKI
jgi:hypothetical protein